MVDEEDEGREEKGRQDHLEGEETGRKKMETVKRDSERTSKKDGNLCGVETGGKQGKDIEGIKERPNIREGGKRAKKRD